VCVTWVLARFPHAIFLSIESHSLILTSGAAVSQELQMQLFAATTGLATKVQLSTLPAEEKKALSQGLVEIMRLLML